jgi:hypothetical protein
MCGAALFLLKFILSVCHHVLLAARGPLFPLSWWRAASKSSSTRVQPHHNIQKPNDLPRQVRACLLFAFWELSRFISGSLSFVRFFGGNSVGLVNKAAVCNHMGSRDF